MMSPSTTPVRGIFFDLYGTLLMYGDMKIAWQDWSAALHTCLRRHGLSLSPEAFATPCDRFFGKEEPPARADEFTVFERRIHTLCEDLNLRVPAEDIRRIATTTVGVWQRHIAPDPECRPVLKALQSQKTLGLISNFNHPPHVHQVLAEFRLADFFEVIVVSGEVGVKKPNPRIFEVALERTGLPPGAVVYVGDTDEDVAGARAAAIRPIAIQRVAAGRERQALDFRVKQETNHVSTIPAEVRVVTRLSELIPLLAEP